MQLVHHVFEPLLKLSAVFGARHQATHVEAQHPFPPQQLRHVPLNNPLGQSFRYGAFADTGFTDQHGVVLCPANQDLDNPLDFLLPPDHRIQLVFLRCRRQIPAEFIQQALFFLAAPAALPAANLGKGQHAREFAQGLLVPRVFTHLFQQFLPRRGKIHPGPPQQRPGNAVIVSEQRQPQMFHRHIPLPELPAFGHAVFKGFLGPGAQFNPGAGVPVCFRIVQRSNLFLQFLRHRLKAHLFAHGLRNRGVGFQQGQQDMFRPDVGLLQVCGDPLGKDQHLLGFLGKTTENRHGKFLSVLSAAGGRNGAEHRVDQFVHAAFHQVGVHPAHAVRAQVPDRCLFSCNNRNGEIRFVGMAFFTQHLFVLLSFICCGLMFCSARRWSSACSSSSAPAARPSPRPAPECQVPCC